MTSALPREPMPGDDPPLVPHMSTLADRLYQRLPEVYRTMDAANDQYAFKRYLAGLLVGAGQVDDTYERIAGDQPVGPATPEPWALSADELEVWRLSRRTRLSALGDPVQADTAWLPWIAQLVGARLDPAASEAERRDTIRYATSGWRGGTRGAIADAAKTALTGTKYALVVPHMVPAFHGGLEPGLVWDISIVTRSSETPDPGAVLDAIARKGVKPAGAVLHHGVYGATWDQVEAVYPLWSDWDGATWNELEAAGLTYRAYPGNLLPNPSFEVDTAGWATDYGANSTLGRVAGGVDGAGMLRVTATAAGTAGTLSTVAPITAPGSVALGFSIRPDVARSGQVVTEFRDGSFSTISFEVSGFPTLPADEWTRISLDYPLPVGTTQIDFYVQLFSMGAGEIFDLDAAIVRRSA